MGLTQTENFRKLPTICGDISLESQKKYLYGQICKNEGANTFGPATSSKQVP